MKTLPALRLHLGPGIAQVCEGLGHSPYPVKLIIMENFNHPQI